MENEILEEKFIDWRGRDTIPGKHGGIRAASIAYGKPFSLNLKHLF